MVESKFVTVIDKGTRTTFLITKFDIDKDADMLSNTGWRLDPENPDTLTMVTLFGPSVKSSAGMSSIGTFKVPEYDIPKRSGFLHANHTTIGLVTAVRNMPLESIPDVLDVRDTKIGK